MHTERATIPYDNFEYAEEYLRSFLAILGRLFVTRVKWYRASAVLESRQRRAAFFRDLTNA